MDFTRLANREREYIVRRLLDFLAAPPHGSERDAFFTIAYVCREWQGIARRALYPSPHFLRPLLNAPLPVTHVSYNIDDYLKDHDGVWYDFTMEQHIIYTSWFELRKYDSWLEWKHEFIVAGFRWEGCDFAVQVDRAWDAPIGWRQYVPLGGLRGGKTAGNELTLMRGLAALPTASGHSVDGVRTVCHVRPEFFARGTLLELLDEAAYLSHNTPRYSLSGINCWAWSRYLLFFFVYEHSHLEALVLDGVEISREAFLLDHLSPAWLDRVRYGQPIPTFLMLVYQTLVVLLVAILPHRLALHVSEWFRNYCVQQVISNLRRTCPRRGRADLQGLQLSSTSVSIASDEKGRVEVSGYPWRLASVDEPSREAAKHMLDERFVEDWGSQMPLPLHVPQCDPARARSPSTDQYAALSRPGLLCYLLCPVEVRASAVEIELCSGFEAGGGSDSWTSESRIFAHFAVVRGSEVLFPFTLFYARAGGGGVSAGDKKEGKMQTRYFRVLADHPVVANARRGDQFCVWVGAEGDAIHGVYGSVVGLNSSTLVDNPRVVKFSAAHLGA